jgi:predicted GNAT family acetyltransferase
MSFQQSAERSYSTRKELLRLGETHLSDLRALFGDRPDAPDAFTPSQLKSGVFYGIYDRQDLVAVAGTHVRSARFKLAAIGNVFTHPEYRGQGFASATTAAVVQDLMADGIETIILNVAQSNTPAVRTYERIGFRTHCAFFEGYAECIKR